MMKIKRWPETFEARKSDPPAGPLSWVSVPVELDSIGLCELRAREGGTASYGVFVMLVQVSAQLPRELRGTLTRVNGKPHTPRTLALKLQIEESEVVAALDDLIDIGWIECDPIESDRIRSNSDESARTRSKSVGSDRTRTNSDESDDSAPTRQERTPQEKDITPQTGEYVAASPSAPGPSLKSSYPSSPEDAKRKAEAIAALRASTAPAKPEPSPEPVSSEVTDVSSKLTPAPYEPPQPPDFGQIDTKPTPKHVLEAWDSAYHLSTGVPYPRTAAASEAKCASQIIKAIEKTGGDWGRIPRSIQAALNDPWAKDKGFKVYASQFAKFDAQGQGGGLSSIERFILEAEEREEAERRAAQ